MNTLDFKYHSTDNGNCRVYYKDPRKRLHCLQLTDRDVFEMLACSRDGEPSHRIHAHTIGTIALPPGDERIECELCTFLKTSRDQLNLPWWLTTSNIEAENV